MLDSFRPTHMYVRRCPITQGKNKLQLVCGQRALMMNAHMQDLVWSRARCTAPAANSSNSSSSSSPSLVTPNRTSVARGDMLVCWSFSSNRQIDWGLVLSCESYDMLKIVQCCCWQPSTSFMLVPLGPAAPHTLRPSLWIFVTVVAVCFVGRPPLQLDRLPARSVCEIVPLTQQSKAICAHTGTDIDSWHTNTSINSGNT